MKEGFALMAFASWGRDVLHFQLRAFDPHSCILASGLQLLDRTDSQTLLSLGYGHR